MKHLGVEVETDERRRGKSSKLKRKEREEQPYTSSRWTPYIKVSGGVRMEKLPLKEGRAERQG